MASNSDRRSSSSVSRRKAHPRPVNFAPVETPRRNTTTIKERPRAKGRTSDPRRRMFERRMRLMLLTVFLLAVTLMAYVVITFSPIFEIKQIIVSPTEHLSNELISEVAAVPTGATLFNYDEKGVVSRLEQLPWVSSVTLTRELPDTLTIEVAERSIVAIVMLANNQEAWRIASDGVWVEEVELTDPASDTSIRSYTTQAKLIARDEGVVYVYDVAVSVKAEAGVACADDGVLGVIDYLTTFNTDMLDLIAFARAASAESISVTLSSGIEVSLGLPTDIERKEEIILGLLSQYAGQISYINVRSVSGPTYRGLTGADELGANMYGEDEVIEDESLPYQQEGDA